MLITGSMLFLSIALFLTCLSVFYRILRCIQAIFRANFLLLLSFSWWIKVQRQPSILPHYASTLDDSIVMLVTKWTWSDWDWNGHSLSNPAVFIDFFYRFELSIWVHRLLLWIFSSSLSIGMVQRNLVQTAGETMVMILQEWFCLFDSEIFSFWCYSKVQTLRLRTNTAFKIHLDKKQKLTLHSIEM